MDNAVSLNQSLNVDIEEMSKALIPLLDEIDKMFEFIDPLLNGLYESIIKLVECINLLIDEMFKAYSLTELSIHDSSISIYETDCLSQAPPVGEKTIKEMALENLLYNMNRYNIPKLVKVFKHELAALSRELIYAYIIYLISKALGMQ